MSIAAERTAQFAAWVAPARARTGLWRLAVGLSLAVGLWVATVLVLGALVGGAAPGTAILAYLFSFAGLILGLGLVARLLHGRSLASLIGPGGFKPRTFALGVAVVGGVLLLTLPLAFAFDPPERQLPLGVWLAGVPPALAALLVQVSAEELLFRGYLPQQLAARFERRLVWWVLPAALFGALHWNPALGPNAWLAAVAAGVTGLALGDVAARAGNLSVAIGLHFANNAVALLFVAIDGPLAVFSLYVAPLDPSDVAAMRAGLTANLALTLVAYGAWRAGTAWRGRSLQSRGPGSI